MVIIVVRAKGVLAIVVRQGVVRGERVHVGESSVALMAGEVGVCIPRLGGRAAVAPLSGHQRRPIGPCQAVPSATGEPRLKAFLYSFDGLPASKRRCTRTFRAKTTSPPGGVCSTSNAKNQRNGRVGERDDVAPPRHCVEAERRFLTLATLVREFCTDAAARRHLKADFASPKPCRERPFMAALPHDTGTVPHQWPASPSFLGHGWEDVRDGRDRADDQAGPLKIGFQHLRNMRGRLGMHVHRALGMQVRQVVANRIGAGRTVGEGVGVLVGFDLADVDVLDPVLVRDNVFHNAGVLAPRRGGPSSIHVAIVDDVRAVTAHIQRGPTSPEGVDDRDCGVLRRLRSLRHRRRNGYSDLPLGFTVLVNGDNGSPRTPKLAYNVGGSRSI